MHSKYIQAIGDCDVYLYISLQILFLDLDVPYYLCERVMNELGKVVVTSIQLDAETVSNLVSLKIVNDGQQLRNASGSSKSESDRVLDYLCPAVKRGGNRALERLYQVLMHTRVGRMGHEELAQRIKKKGVCVCALLSHTQMLSDLLCQDYLAKCIIIICSVVISKYICIIIG